MTEITNRYLLIPKNDVTRAMVNRSTSNEATEMPLVTIDTVQYRVLGITEEHLLAVSGFDDYKWYSATEIRKLIIVPND